MRKAIQILVTFCFLFNANIVNADQIRKNSLKQFAGVYRCSSNHKRHAIPPDQQIVLEVSQTGLKGTFFGANSVAQETGDAEEGWLFFEVPMSSLEITDDGKISFEVGKRIFYSEPASLKKRQNVGLSRTRLLYEGMIRKDEIRLNCKGEGCWTDLTMFFKRVKK